MFFCYQNYCSHFRGNKQCSFCNLVSTAKVYESVIKKKNLDKIGEVTQAAWSEGAVNHVNIAGGCFNANLPFNGKAISEDFVASPNCEAADDIPGFWTILQGHSLLVTDGEGDPTLPFGDLPHYFAAEHEPVCIGFWQGKPLRVFSIGARNEIPLPYVAMPFRGAETRLNEPFLTLAGLACQILNWERMSVFCSRCGSRMERISGTWGKRCLSCRHEHFPAIHPCVIVLVRCGDEVLLVRKAEWPAGRYGLVAGFVEFGESLEACVRREVREETGVEVGNVRYVGSQS